MRKYRGKALDNLAGIKAGEWVYGWYIEDKDGGKAWMYILRATFDTSYINSFVPVNPSTVGQSIGLKDKNGVEIYEGDILRRYGGAIIVVKWSDAEFNISDGSLYEVIGNIHSNPELLEKR